MAAEVIVNAEVIADAEEIAVEEYKKVKSSADTHCFGGSIWWNSVP